MISNSNGFYFCSRESIEIEIDKTILKVVKRCCAHVVRKKLLLLFFVLVGFGSSKRSFEREGVVLGLWFTQKKIEEMLTPLKLQGKDK